MAQISWIKVSVNLFNDDKIVMIMLLPQGKDLVLLWLRMLLKAGQINNNGYINSNGEPFTNKELASILCVPEDLLVLGLQLFSSNKYQMIEINDKGIFIVNWEKHQSADRLDAIREYERAKKQKYRDRKKGNVPGQVPGSPDTEEDTDKDIYSTDNITDSSAYKDFQNNINPMPGPIVLNKLIVAINEFGNKMISFAISQAASNEKRSWSYIEKILANWNGKGIKNIEEAMADYELFKASKGLSGKGGNKGGNNKRGTGVADTPTVNTDHALYNPNRKEKV